jgi:hypothetical protein
VGEKIDVPEWRWLLHYCGWGELVSSSELGTGRLGIDYTGGGSVT